LNCLRGKKQTAIKDLNCTNSGVIVSKQVVHFTRYFFPDPNPRTQPFADPGSERSAWWPNPKGQPKTTQVAFHPKDKQNRRSHCSRRTESQDRHCSFRCQNHLRPSLLSLSIILGNPPQRGPLPRLRASGLSLNNQNSQDKR